jgi:hypothetical protein
VYAQRDGLPDPGWAAIPFAYASAALKLGDLYGTRRLVDESYNVLKAAKYQIADVQESLRKYRALASKTGQRLDLAIGNLVDDLWRSAHPTSLHFRAEIMALLWTLGCVPECQSMRFSDYVPTRSFLKRIVWLSIERVPYDPLIQFVWLEMKDKPPFNLRDHGALFNRLNQRYNQYMPDELWEVIPSQIYAQTLIAWLKGEIDSAQVERYLAVIEEVRQYEETRLSSDKADWSLYLRMISFAYLLAREFDKFAGEVSQETEFEVWNSLWSQVIRMRGKYHFNPHRPDLSGTLNYPLFHLIENELAARSTEETSGNASCGRLINSIEKYRAAALSYALTVSPPLVSKGETHALGDLPNDERQLLQWLRGAFFLIHYEFLPDHFRRFATDPAEYLEGNDPKRLLNLETGRKEYLEVKEQLDAMTMENEIASSRIRDEASRALRRRGSHYRCAKEPFSRSIGAQSKEKRVTFFISSLP